MLNLANVMAYIGPGAGLGAILLAVGLGLGVLLLVVGLVWYPLKRFLRSGSEEPTTSAQATAEQATTEQATGAPPDGRA